MVAQHRLFLQVLISRGLQLEGQVVTEEQDLQVMVMTSQKTSPIQYLHASAIQDRVRAAVAQSQASLLFVPCLSEPFSCASVLNAVGRSMEHICFSNVCDFHSRKL